MAKNVLAFDFGASNGRAMLVSCRDGKMEMTEVHRFPNDTVILGDRMYWDFPRLMYEVKQAILKAVKLSKIDAIGIDTWGGGFRTDRPIRRIDLQSRALPRYAYGRTAGRGGGDTPGKRALCQNREPDHANKYSVSAVLSQKNAA